MNEKFSYYDEKVFRVFILMEVEEEIRSLKDKKGQKKIFNMLDRLLERIPNSPELWRRIENCETAYELKPKPYRLGCFFDGGKDILVVHLWRVQSKKSKTKRQEIEKTCEIIKEEKDEFKRFAGKI